MFVAMEMEVELSGTQVAPSEEEKLENVLPERTNRAQTFGSVPVPAATEEAAPEVLLRFPVRIVPSGERPTEAYRDPGARVSRIITPACALAPVFCTEVNRERISPSPLI